VGGKPTFSVLGPVAEVVVGRPNDELYELCVGPVGEMGFELISVEEVRERGRRVLRFYIDHGAGISVEDCAAVSRELEYVLDEQPEPSGPYVVEVSSPGLDHELVSEREYEHFSGRKARLVLRQAIGERSVVAGVILGAHEGSATLKCDDGAELIVAISNIASARLVP
jgi:ribosome maturation factor RimP